MATVLKEVLDIKFLKPVRPESILGSVGVVAVGGKNVDVGIFLQERGVIVVLAQIFLR